jgi:5'-deoxynucleotidase YfbR-like HD superfamily hydrolase
MDPERLARQIRFALEIDKLKGIVRRTLRTDGSRMENTAEHSWHIGVLAILLSEYAEAPDLDLFRAVRMLLIHDVVEIDAGDTLCYDIEARKSQQEREMKAADRIFNLLPGDQASQFRELWLEFESVKTPEARFAHALDRLQPLLQAYHTRGRTWRHHGVTRAQLTERMRPIERAVPALWPYTLRLIDDAVAQGFLLP